MVECSLMNYVCVVVGSNPVPVTYILNIALFTNKELIELQVTFWNKFHKIQVCDMTKKHTIKDFTSAAYHFIAEVTL